MNNYCHRQFDKDERTYSEIFAEMKARDWAYINGEQVWLCQITDRIDTETYARQHKVQC